MDQLDQYNEIAETVSRALTLRYSSSFGLASSLYPREIRRHIYNIYGLVRIADEIVDTYRGPAALQILNDLEADTMRAIEVQYSANIIVQAFAVTAKTFGINQDLIAPFFESMRSDLVPQTFDEVAYRQYIYGSAEVVGLMCLRVFVGGDQLKYDHLQAGASRLGAAYQKINFLRDLAADHAEMGRFYFPGTNMDDFDNAAKNAVVGDIDADLAIALPAIRQLPTTSRRAVMTSYSYYHKLLERLRVAPVSQIKQQRLRISNGRKLGLLVQTVASDTLKPGKAKPDESERQK